MNNCPRIQTRFHDETKPRMVKLNKNAVYSEVDGITFKYIDSQPMQTSQQDNAVQSDSTEHLDGALIARMVEYRDSELRLMLRSVLADEVVVAVDNVIEVEPSFFIYKMDMPIEFKDANLKALADMFHRYLVYGALFDWYSESGIMSQARIYADQIADLETKIKSAIHPAGYAKRPLQPFGSTGRIPF